MEDKKKELNETIDATKKAENTQEELKDEQLNDVAGGVSPNSGNNNGSKLNLKFRFR